MIKAIEAATDSTPEELLEVALAAAARLDGTAGPLELETLDATAEYVSRQGDTLDLIAQERYGSAVAVRRIQAANPDLTHLGPILPVGTRVRLPDVEVAPAETIEVVQLWD